MWFGFGLLPKVLIVVLVTFFPIVVALLDGFGRRRPGGDGPAALVRRDGAPDVPQAALAGGAAVVLHRAADRVVYAVIGAVFGEYVGATRGPGDLDAAVAERFRTDLVFAAILLTAVVSVALYWAWGSSSASSCRGRRGAPWRSRSGRRVSVSAR